MCRVLKSLGDFRISYLAMSRDTEHSTLKELVSYSQLIRTKFSNQVQGRKCRESFLVR